MPRPKATIPKFCIDRNGRAFTKVDGRFISLGRGDDPKSRQRYAVVLTEHAQGRTVERARQPAPTEPRVLSVNELLLQYAAKELPRFSEGEQHPMRCVIRILRELFGETPAAEFGPLRLRVVRDAMIAGDPNATNAEGKPKPRKPWSRGVVNKQIKRVRAIFRWGVSFELVPQTVADALASVRSIVAGETSAEERAPRVAVPQEHIESVRAKLRPQHRDVLDLLLLTGARPGEIINLTTGMLDRTGDVWRCELSKHKTAHKGKRRVLFFNATAQLILRKYLKADPGERLFGFSRNDFSNTMQRACDRARVPRFVPHQLRHTVITKVMDELGAESAQRLAGHSTSAMTEHYGRAADRKAMEAVQRLG